MESPKSQYLLMEEKEYNRRLIIHKDKCDKCDYLAAVCCGVIGGLADVFLVGIPGESVLGKWTDTQVDNAVKRFAGMLGWNPREENKDNIASAIGFLERKFKVNYDQRHAAEVDGMFQMSTKNHHMKNLSHSPDIIGLFFSVLNQFTSTASFIANGQLITIATDTFELQGHNFTSRLFCGVANWFGHIMSDVAGSSGSVGNGGRGTGVVIPFFELLQFCRFGKFTVGKDKQDFATIAVRAFQEGYDFRFGLELSLPVFLVDLLIRLIWALRRHFQYHKTVRECIPTSQHDDLRIMLLLGNGTLCLIDGMDAGIRSGGNFLTFFMRLNIIAWTRFVGLVFKEVCIRIGITDPYGYDIEALKRINEALEFYLAEIQKFDLELYKNEVTECVSFVSALSYVKTEQELNELVVKKYGDFGLTELWEGSFDAHMSDPNKRLIYKY